MFLSPGKEREMYSRAWTAVEGRLSAIMACLPAVDVDSEALQAPAHMNTH